MRKMLMTMAVLSGCAAAGAAARADMAASVEEIHGFQVDFHLVSSKQRDKVLPSLNRQFEIIEAVNLPAKVLEFFHTIPFVADPDLTQMNGEYKPMDGRWVVHVKLTDIPADRAIMLHELLHAYQHQVLGEPTPPVGRAYQQALRPGTYPSSFRGAYFLKNGKEFFAVVGEVFLFGGTFRPPFKCSTVQQAQPEFIAYLTGLFGPHECK
jgi:hypothetical protein